MRVASYRMFVVLFCIGFYISNAQIKVIKAGYLIDTKSEEVLRDKYIIIEGNTIKDIVDNYVVNLKDEFIDLSNSYVLPGLIDCHVHLTMNASYRNWNMSQKYIEESTAFRALRGAKNAELFLQNGFTTVKEIGNDGNYATADIIKAIEKGWIKGPNIAYVGKIIGPYGGQLPNISYEHKGLWEYEYINADSKNEIIKAIRQNRYYGANAIKLVSSSENTSYYSIEEIEAAVNEAKKTNMKVSVHTNGGESSKNAILGGVASIEHGLELTDELLKLMKEKGTYLVGTDFSFDNLYAYGLDSITAKNYHNMFLNRLIRANQIGVKLAFGTDVIIDLPNRNRVESSLEILKTWKEANISPMKTLKAMTYNASDLLGISNERGVIVSKYIADIIALNKNPLENIENIKSVHFVMKEGNVIRND